MTVVTVAFHSIVIIKKAFFGAVTVVTVVTVVTSIPLTPFLTDCNALNTPYHDSKGCICHAIKKTPKQ